MIKKITYKISIIFVLFLFNSCNNYTYKTNIDNFENIFAQIKSSNQKSGSIIINIPNKKWDYITLCRPFMFGSKLSEEIKLNIDEAIQAEKELEKLEIFRLFIVYNQHIIDSIDVIIEDSSIQSNYGYIFITPDKNYFEYQINNNVIYLYGNDRISKYIKDHPNAPTHEYVW